MLRRLTYAPQASLKSRNQDVTDAIHCLGFYSSASYSRVVNQKKNKEKNRENLGLMLRRLTYAPQASLKSRNQDASDAIHCLGLYSSSASSQVVNQKKNLCYFF